MAESQNQFDNCYRLTDRERDALGSILAACQGKLMEMPQVAPAFLVSAGVPVERISHALFHAPHAHFIIRNLPIDTRAAFRKGLNTPIADATLLGLIAALGMRTFGYVEEKQGDLIHDVHPVPGREEAVSNAGRIPLPLHVDNPYLPRAARPDVLALFALNNDAQCATRLVAVADLVAAMSAADLSELKRPAFLFRHAESFDLNGYTIYSPRSPVLKSVHGCEELRCAVFIKTADAAAEGAITRLKAVAELLALEIILNPGDLLIFNNRRCIHGRDEVCGERWLKRVYGTREFHLLDAGGLINVWSCLSSPSLDHTF